MYKEAKKLNLDQDDEIVKRRLSQKMEYLANDLTQIVAPATDENLKQYFEDNYKKYELPPSYSFNLITISNNQHEEPAHLAIKVLAAADKKSKESLLNKGDPLLLPAQFEDASKEQIVKTVGTSFYDALSGQPLNTWVGPISSGYGEHLVFISDMKERRLPDFATVRKEIQRDYEFDMQTHAKGAIYREMKKQYTVVIDSELFNSHQKQTVSASLSGVR
ncbi:peptidyl-prolyl cis-trans isomerase [Pseudoalteromonas sp. GB56]